MAQLSPLKRYEIGQDALTIADPTCAGRIYVPHLYDAQGRTITSPNQDLGLRFVPQVGRSKCQVDPDDESDEAETDTACGVPLKGTDWNKYGITPNGPPLANPVYELDFGPFFSPCAGRLMLVTRGEESYDGAEPVYVSISHRRIAPGEIPPPWTYTFQDTGRGVSAPHGGFAVQSPAASEVVRLFYQTGFVDVTLTNGILWPCPGVQRFAVASGNPLTVRLYI